MNEYKFKVVDYKKFTWVLMSYVCLILVISGYVGALTKNVLLTFSIVVVAAVLFSFLKKNILNVRTIKIVLSENSIIIKDLNIILPYSDIKWYRLDDRGGLFIETFVFKSVKYGISKIYYYKKDNNLQWTVFKTDFEIKIKNNQSQTINYYESVTWSYVVILLIASFITIPFLFYFLEIESSLFKKILPAILVYYGTGATLIATVLMNRKKKVD